MKRVTMELGGHAPALVFDDADLDQAATILAANKFRNAGQVCVAPTRFLVQEGVYEPFLEKFVAKCEAIKLGNGLDDGTTMGPLANDRRVSAMESLIADAVGKGAKVRTGGKRSGNKGYFFEPTVLTDIPSDARVLHEEPFGPLALMLPFQSYEQAIAEANRLDYGLAAYAYTRNTGQGDVLGSRHPVRHGGHQPSWSGAAGNAVWRREGFRLRVRRRRGRAGALSGDQVRHPGERLRGQIGAAF